MKSYRRAASSRLTGGFSPEIVKVRQPSAVRHAKSIPARLSTAHPNEVDTPISNILNKIARFLRNELRHVKPPIFFSIGHGLQKLFVRPVLSIADWPRCRETKPIEANRVITFVYKGMSWNREKRSQFSYPIYYQLNKEINWPVLQKLVPNRKAAPIHPRSGFGQVGGPEGRALWIPVRCGSGSETLECRSGPRRLCRSRSHRRMVGERRFPLPALTRRSGSCRLHASAAKRGWQTGYLLVYKQR